MSIKPAPADAESVTFEFEAVGFVATRRSMSALDARDTPSPEVMFAKMRTQLEALGFTGVDDVTLSEDDGQDSTDIKVFVVVKLEGPKSLADGFSRELPASLIEVLDTLSKYVCCTARGEDRVGAENWELANSYEFA